MHGGGGEKRCQMTTKVHKIACFYKFSYFLQEKSRKKYCYIRIL